MNLLKITLILAISALGFQGQASFIKSKTMTHKVDLDKSSVGWSGEKYDLVDKGSKHNGDVRLKSGNLVVKDGKITGGNIEIDMNSIQNKDIQDPKKKGQLEGHLKSDDFFHIKKYPTANFKIQGVSHISGNKKKVTGLLKIHGVEKEESFTVTVSKDGKIFKASGTITLDRSKYGVTYNSEAGFLKKIISVPIDKVIKDKITLELNLVTKSA